MQCFATLKSSETECYACGSPVATDTGRINFARRFASGIHIAFLICAVLTVLSLFLDISIPFAKLLPTTLVLLIVKSSAVEMMERKSRK
jgi:hypothetical protein